MLKGKSPTTILRYPLGGVKVIIALITSSSSMSTTSIMNGVGLVTQTQLTTDPEGTDYTDTTYDGLGQVWKESNPHRSGSLLTDGTTTNSYDALGRIISITHPDGTAATSSYSGNCTTITDETNRSRKSCSDGLGRMTGVWEDPSGLNYATSYGYDALGDLTNVLQNGSRPRAFTYDSLGRLLSASNPEIGTPVIPTTPMAIC